MRGEPKETGSGRVRGSRCQVRGISAPPPVNRRGRGRCPQGWDEAGPSNEHGWLGKPRIRKGCSVCTVSHVYPSVLRRHPTPCLTESMDKSSLSRCQEQKRRSPSRWGLRCPPTLDSSTAAGARWGWTPSRSGRGLGTAWATAETPAQMQEPVPRGLLGDLPGFQAMPRRWAHQTADSLKHVESAKCP